MKKTLSFIIVLCICFVCFATGKMTTPLSLSLTERFATQSVEYLNKVWLQHESNYFILFFALTDKSQNVKTVPVHVDIRIVNSNGEEVYNDTKTVKASDYAVWSSQARGEMTLASIIIRDSEIKPGSSESGTLYFKVYNPTYIEFDELDVEINSILGNSLPFKADYSDPIKVDPYTLDADFDNPLKAKKLYAGKPVQLTVKISYISSSYDGKYYISASDYKSGGSYSSYYISVYVEDSELDKLAEYSIGQKITVCGFVDFDSYSLDIVHAKIIK